MNEYNCKSVFLPEQHSINLIILLYVQGAIFSFIKKLRRDKTRVFFNLKEKFISGIKLKFLKKICVYLLYRNVFLKLKNTW